MDGGYLVCATPPSVYIHPAITILLPLLYKKNTGGGHKFFEFACLHYMYVLRSMDTNTNKFISLRPYEYMAT